MKSHEEGRENTSGNRTIMDLTAKVTLLPVKNRFKQLIKQYGRIWNVVWESDSLICFNGRPGIHIKSNDGKHERWVELHEIEAL